MSQIPITPGTFSKLNVIKTKALVQRNGSCLTWNNLIETFIELSAKHEKEFYEMLSTIKNE